MPAKLNSTQPCWHATSQYLHGTAGEKRSHMPAAIARLHMMHGSHIGGPKQ